MATHTYSINTEGATVGNTLDHTFQTLEAFTVPTGQQFKQFKVSCNVSTSGIEFRGAAQDIFGANWDTYKTTTTGVWSNGGKASVKVHNGSGASKAMTLTVTWQTEDLPYTPVTAGNKILATDRSQTGTSTTAGTVMTDSHFTAGTKIEASTFNSRVLGR